MTTDRATGPAPRPRMGPLGRRLTLAFVGVAVTAVGLVTAAALVGTGRGLETATAAERRQVAALVAVAAGDAYVAAGGWAEADLTEAAAIAAAAGADLVVLDQQDQPVEHGAGQGHGPGGDAGSGTGGGTGGGTDGGTGGGTGDGSPGTGTGAGSGAGSGSGSGSGTGSGSGAADHGQGSEEEPLGSTGSPQPSAPPSGQGGGGATAAELGAVALVADGAGTGGGSASAPVMVDGEQVGTVRLLFRSPADTAARTIAWWWIAVAALAALALALVAARLVTLRVARPLASVAATARRFAAGDRSARTGMTGSSEVSDVAHALDDMADEVVASEQSRRRAAADIAHELRTPLAALQAGLEEVRDGLVEPDPVVLAGLHDQSLRLGRIVADLAALAAAEGGTMHLRLSPVDLARLVRDEVQAEEPRLRAADLVVSVTADGAVPVSADPDRLRQILDNLLSNAARYCRSGDSVAVTVRCRDDRAVLEVSDTGPGIRAEDLPHVFDRLWRGHEADRVGGSGIGLAVVRELVTAHGGTVTAESDGESGTTMRVELPLAGAPASAGGPAALEC